MHSLFKCLLVSRILIWYLELTEITFHRALSGWSTVFQWEFFSNKLCPNSSLPSIHCRDSFWHQFSKFSNRNGTGVYYSDDFPAHHSHRQKCLLRSDLYPKNCHKLLPLTLIHAVSSSARGPTCYPSPPCVTPQATFDQDTSFADVLDFPSGVQIHPKLFFPIYWNTISCSNNLYFIWFMWYFSSFRYSWLVLLIPLVQRVFSPTMSPLHSQ